MLRSCHPVCRRALDALEDFDESQNAAIVAANLISSARFLLKLDSEFTELSAQFLVDKASPENESAQGRRKLTVKDCLEIAFKEGIPKLEHWAHLGCIFKPPGISSFIARVPVKGLEVVEAKKLEEGLALMRQFEQPVGARLHVFSPQLDRLGDKEIYDGPAGPGGAETRYVGLRDCIVCDVKKFKGTTVAKAKITYKTKTSFIYVSLQRMFLAMPKSGEESQVIEPTHLLVDFCLPRLSK
ncbi:unnamed protein product [Microthlaspi erraticum]|uniref:Uncharacterized protein n=1 Tax=Microthlaspi erraticum TaxID=1685480 RepID=A0A6D2I5I0_9BRAS|nr:unnamed protein product [Microthlaspi erraticum]